jgi:prevent-host-death family protein
MRQVGVYEAKTQLPRLLDRVARGERITITRHGRPVAVLVPAASQPARALDEVIDELRDFKKGRRLGRVALKTLINEGRR